MKTSVVDVSRRRRSVSTAVKSEAMPRPVLTAQLIVDKHHAMVLANVTFKALAAIWHRHTRTCGGSSICVITDTIKCGALDDERQTWRTISTSVDSAKYKQ